MTPKEAFEAIPFDDDADEPQTWRGIALSAISDMYRYAEDGGPERRYVSADAYAEDAIRLAAQQDGGWQPIEPIKKPHRTMTPQEYAEFKIVGWHQVCKNVDLAGNVGVRYGGDPEQGASS